MIHLLNAPFGRGLISYNKLHQFQMKSRLKRLSVSNVPNFCRNDELNWWFTNRFSATRNMKVKRMGITESLRRIWLFSANKIKSSESVSKQPTQLIIVAEIRRTWLLKE